MQPLGESSTVEVIHVWLAACKGQSMPLQHHSLYNIRQHGCSQHCSFHITLINYNFSENMSHTAKAEQSLNNGSQLWYKCKPLQ